MSAQHTPGPYSYLLQQGGHEIVAGDGYRLCSLSAIVADGSGRREQFPDGIIRSREVQQANVEFVHRAISSHDELLAACEAVKLAQARGTYAEAFAAVDAAIAKATGSTK